MKKLLLLLLLCTVGVTNLAALSFDDGYLKYTVNADGTTVTVNGRKSGITASGSPRMQWMPSSRKKRSIA